MAAPKGNKNAVRKPWQDALKRALARDSGSVTAGLLKIANQVVELANNGEQWAIKEIAERLDGKVAQQQILTGFEDGPVVVESITRRIVKADEPGHSDT